MAKAVYQSDSLILIDYKGMVRHDKQDVRKNSFEYKQRQINPSYAFRKSLELNC
jgi:hypothetical protein